MPGPARPPPATADPPSPPTGLGAGRLLAQKTRQYLVARQPHALGGGHSTDQRAELGLRMPAEHALLLKTYAAETDGRARFMGHSAFVDPTTAPRAPRRESIEARTMACF